MLNVGHALDHLALLVFASSVGAIAADFGIGRWEDVMPLAAGAFCLFGLGALPAGRLGDLWGRRAMMLVYFFGLAGSLLLIAMTRSPWQLAIALTVMGAFASIYHPVGIPMLVQGAARPGSLIGLNGLAGNLGIAVAAVLTGFLIKYAGWRFAFVVPGVIAGVCGLLFALRVPAEETRPAKREASQLELPRALAARVLVVVTLTASSSSLIFNFTTNGNGELLTERLRGLISDPATLGVLLAIVYAFASMMQVVVGRLIDRVSVRLLYLSIVGLQVPLFFLASILTGWTFYLVLVLTMALVFGGIPFTDALIVRYVDDRVRSRVSGARFAVSFSISSIAVYLLGPLVKAHGFTSLLVLLSVVAAGTAIFVLMLPSTIPLTMASPLASE
ncbi:MAG TPA: MFS transporter [Casimicrobiaceae bacterium]|nr:MFS transporter [Casimicrobiaceae bacterium]